MYSMGLHALATLCLKQLLWAVQRRVLASWLRFCFILGVRSVGIGVLRLDSRFKLDRLARIRFCNLLRNSLKAYD